MQRNVWKFDANLRMKRLSNYTKLQLSAWMTINLKKKMDRLENCPPLSISGIGFLKYCVSISVFNSRRNVHNVDIVH